jgi:hypothetical protein
MRKLHPEYCAVASGRVMRPWGIAMRYTAFSFLGLLALVLTSCASPYQVAQLPERDADLYPLAQSKAGVTIAIDEIRNPERARLYFGADLIGKRIVPVAVVISNHAEHRVDVRPANVLLYRGKEIVDPLPLELVVEAAKREHALHSGAGQQIDDFFRTAALNEKVVLAHETYQGVMFFPAPKPRKRSDDFFMLNLYREAAVKLRVDVTVLDTGDRLHFGPFSLSLGESSNAF